MDNQKSKIPGVQDDLEVEITSLDMPTSSSLQTGTGVGRDTSAPTELLRGRRQRVLALSVSIMIGLVLLLTLVLPSSLPTLSALTKKLFTTGSAPIPPSTPRALIQTNRFYLDVNIPWTQVFLDGHRIAVPRPAIDPPLTLKPGQHNLKWQAEPFEVQSCRITIPFSVYDTCSFLAQESSKGQTAFLISLNQSLATLSAERNRALINATQKAFADISATNAVKAGELYYTNAYGYVAAQKPLQATLRYDFMRDPLLNQPYTLEGIPCIQLCIVPEQVHLPQMQHLAPSQWLAVAFISLSWSYTTQDGHVVASDQSIGVGNAGINYAYPTLVRISWNDVSGWHVAPLIGPELGPAITTRSAPDSITGSTDTVQIVTDTACAVPQDLIDGDAAFYFSLRLVSSSNPAVGCLAIAAVDPANQIVAPPALVHSPVALYFDRLGVLWAVNDIAHRLHPEYQEATPYIRSLAQQFLHLPGQTVDIP